MASIYQVCKIVGACPSKGRRLYEQTGGNLERVLAILIVDGQPVRRSVGSRRRAIDNTELEILKEGIAKYVNNW